MPFNPQGQWIPEDDSVASRVTALTTGSSPLLTAARTSGAQFANKRGLLNSSIAAGASENAALGYAVPIASQDAQQTYGKNTTSMSLSSQERQQAGQIASTEMQQGRQLDAAKQQQALEAALTSNNQYAAGLASIAQNADLPAATREAYMQTLLNTRNSGADVISKLYGINLDWGSVPVADAAPIYYGDTSSGYADTADSGGGGSGGGGGGGLKSLTKYSGISLLGKLL